MVRVRALQRVYYAGKEYAPGEDFEATDTHALQLGAIRKVMRAEAEAATQQPKSEAETPIDEPPKGRHRRRDLKAED